MSIDLAQFIPGFLAESHEGLDIMERALLALTPGDAEAINEVFRAAHSIKGGAGTFGFTAVADFTHQAETLLDAMRNGSVEVSPERNRLLLQAVDCIRALLEQAQQGDQSMPAEAARLAEALAGARASAAAQQASPSTASAETTVADAGVAAGWQIRLVPDPGLLMTGNDPLLLLTALAELGPLQAQAGTDRLPVLAELEPEQLYLDWQLRLTAACDETDIRELFAWVEDDVELSLPPLAELEPTELHLSWQFELAGDCDEAAIRDLFEWVEDSVQLTLQPAATGAAEPAPQPTAVPARAQAAASGGPDAAPVVRTGAVRKAEPSIRVDTGKVDALVDRVGELVITQAMLMQVSQALAELEHPAVEALQKGLLQLERNTRELQEDVMRIRMQPISSVFNRFPRLVHDVSQQLGKQVALHLDGEQTELDKTVLEKIGDPLVHLIRNGLDHGLEAPDAREAAGKPSCGNLWLSAAQQGGSIVIEIRDDGRGLDRERILAKAVERGLVAADSRLADGEIDELIFLPGFSTAEQVSDLSGRGVGMDVVRRNIESLGGSIEVRSSPGLGSRFTIRLPLTLAIMDGQLVRLDSDPYVIPMIAIVETLQASAGMLISLAGSRCLLHFRDEYIPLLPLASLFGLSPRRPLQPGSLVVVVEFNGSKAGLVVDELMGQQQTVIKSLEKNFKRVPGVSGATILGDGTVALILDVACLVSQGIDADLALLARQKNSRQEAQA